MIPEHYHIRKWLDDPIKYLTGHYRDVRNSDTWFPLIIKAEEPHLNVTGLIGPNKVMEVYVPEGIETFSCVSQGHLKKVTLPISIEKVYRDEHLEIENWEEIKEINPDVWIQDYGHPDHQNMNLPFRKHYWV